VRLWIENSFHSPHLLNEKSEAGRFCSCEYYFLRPMALHYVHLGRIHTSCARPISALFIGADSPPFFPKRGRVRVPLVSLENELRNLGGGDGVPLTEREEIGDYIFLSPSPALIHRGPPSREDSQQNPLLLSSLGLGPPGGVSKTTKPRQVVKGGFEISTSGGSKSYLTVSPLIQKVFQPFSFHVSCT